MSILMVNFDQALSSFISTFILNSFRILPLFGPHYLYFTPSSTTNSYVLWQYGSSIDTLHTRHITLLPTFAGRIKHTLR